MEIPTGYMTDLVKRAPSNAMTPLLWLNFMISVPCLSASIYLETEFRFALFGLAAALIVFSCVQYHALRKTNPRFLISESMQYELAKLDMIAEKGGTIRFGTVDVSLGSDPGKKAARRSVDDDEGGAS